MVEQIMGSKCVIFYDRSTCHLKYAKFANKGRKDQNVQTINGNIYLLFKKILRNDPNHSDSDL